MWMPKWTWFHEGMSGHHGCEGQTFPWSDFLTWQDFFSDLCAADGYIEGRRAEIKKKDGKKAGRWPDLIANRSMSHHLLWVWICYFIQFWSLRYFYMWYPPMAHGRYFPLWTSLVPIVWESQRPDLQFFTMFPTRYIACRCLDLYDWWTILIIRIVLCHLAYMTARCMFSLKNP